MLQLEKLGEVEGDWISWFVGKIELLRGVCINPRHIIRKWVKDHNDFLSLLKTRLLILNADCSRK